MVINCTIAPFQLFDETLTLRRIIIISVIVLALLGGGGLYGWWWFNHATLDFGRFRPQIEAAIAETAPGMKVTLGPITGRQILYRNAVEVQIGSSTIQHPTLARPATIMALTVELDRKALFAGQIALQNVRARGVTLSYTFSRTELLKAPASNSKRALPWSPGLRAIQLEQVRLDLFESDSHTPAVVDIPSLSARTSLLARDRIDLAAIMDVHGSDLAAHAQLSGTATPSGPWEATIDLGIDGLTPFLQHLLPVEHLPMLTNHVHIAAKLNQREQLHASFNMHLGPGEYRQATDQPAFFAAPLKLLAVDAAAAWDEHIPHLNLSSAAATINGVHFKAKALFNLARFDNSIIDATFDHADVPQLLSLWPLTTGRGGRVWVARNITQGSVRDGEFHLRHGRIGFDYKFDHLYVDYRRPMPPLLAAQGTAHLTDDGMVMQINSGQIGNLRVTPAKLVFTDWNGGPGNLAVSMPIDGTMPRLLTLLDSEPLNYISRFGLQPARVGGNVIGKVEMRFPLIADLRIDALKIAAHARINNANLPDVYAGRALERGDLELDVNERGLRAEGQAWLGAQPLAIVWQEDFSGQSTSPTHYIIKGATTVATLATLGVDLSGMAAGRLLLDLDLRGRKGSITAGQFRADIRNARISLPVFGEVKAIGDVAAATGELQQDGRQLQLNNLQLISDTVTASAEGQVPLDVGTNHFAIKSLRFGENDLAGEIDFATGKPLSIQMRGSTIDFRTVLRNFRSAAPAPAEASASNVTAPQLTHMTAHIDRVRLSDVADLTKVSADLELRADQLDRLTAKANLGGSDVSASVTSKLLTRQVQLRASDAGAMAQALDLFSSGHGGDLTVNATLSGRGKDLAITGTALMKKFRVGKTPALAKILTVASLTGLVDTLSGRGITFETTSVPFQLRRGVFDIRGARATGPALGITMEGQVLQSLGQTNLRGVLIPSYGVNSALSNIPLLGTMLTGGKGQGIIGFNYRITGPVNDPKVNVAAASGLALGPLRMLFRGGAAKVTPPAANETAPAADAP